MRKVKLLLLLLVFAALVTGGYLLLRDLSAPVLALAPADGALSARRALALTVTDAGTGLPAATAWLASVPAGRREIAIVSDFQQGAIDAGDVARVPPDIGIRCLRAGPPVPPDPHRQV